MCQQVLPDTVTLSSPCRVPRRNPHARERVFRIRLYYKKNKTDGLNHDLRRSFIHDEMDRLIEKGHSTEEAAKLVAKEVGHNRTEVLCWYGQW